MLQDSIGRTITSFRVSITDRCNLRCRYCMPEDGVQFIEHTEILRYEEIERILGVAAQLGIVKIRITGGEPLVRKGVVDFAKRVSRIPGIQKLSITTNAILLSQYALPLKDAGIQYLNLSLDTLNREKFSRITRFDQLPAVLAGISAAKRAGFPLIKVNVVSMRGFNDDELFDFIEFADRYALVIRFIEYMPFSGNGWQQSYFVPSEELRERLETRWTLLPLDEDPSSPAKTYHIAGHAAKVGFISSVSESFCGACNRLRLTADGFLRPCLHGNIEVNIKTPLRRGASDQEIADLIQSAADQKPAFHRDFLDHPQSYHSLCDREMVRIGG